MSIPQILFLAAGVSKRMHPISDKIFLTFNGKTLLEHQIELLLSCVDTFQNKEKIAQIVVVLNKYTLQKAQKILERFAERVICVMQEKLEEGMKGALDSSVIHIKKSVLIINSNDIVEKSLIMSFLEESQNTNTKGMICGKVVNSYFPGGYISHKNNILTSIVEKPKPGSEPSDLVNIVVHYFQDFHVFYKEVNKHNNISDDAYEQGLQSFSQKNEVKVYEYNGFWQAIKFPFHILEAQKYFLSLLPAYIHPSASIASSAVIRGNVYIDEGVRVFDHSSIIGPCYIGKNTIIGNNTLVRESCVGESSVIGFSTEIARSFLHKKIWTHSNYIGDSVIDDNVSFGAGSVTGNLRLDEKEIFYKYQEKKIPSNMNKLGSIIGTGVRIGINSSINPGVCIGKNSFIGGNVSVIENIPDETFLLEKKEYIVKKNNTYVDINTRNF